MLVLCLAAVGGIGYLYLTSTVEVSFQDCVATDAVTQQELFTRLTSQLAEGTLQGTPFTREVPTTPEGYQFYTFTLQVENRSFLPAEMIEIQITPMEGDVLQPGDSAIHNLAARHSTQVTATLLTTYTAHNVRELTVTYYIWGFPFSTRLTTR